MIDKKDKPLGVDEFLRHYLSPIHDALTPLQNKIFMTRRKSQRNKKENSNDEPEDNNEASTSNIFPEVEFTASNFTASSNNLPANTNASSEVPLEVKHYIDAAFEKTNPRNQNLVPKLS